MKALGVRDGWTKLHIDLRGRKQELDTDWEILMLVNTNLTKVSAPRSLIHGTFM